MSRHYVRRTEPRPRRTGAFFDYVIAATHAQATRAQATRARTFRAALARRELRLDEGGSTSAEQRWEGEGGNMQCAPGGKH